MSGDMLQQNEVTVGDKEYMRVLGSYGKKVITR